MVTFVCESCNETLKKNQVEKHGHRCRQCHVTCVDCSRTFSLEDYSQHTSCVSEAEKYEKSLYKAKTNAKVNPQDAWMQLIAEAATRKSEAPSNIAEHLGRLSELDNVPRNCNKFSNFAKNSLRLNNSSTVDGIWKFLEKLKAEKEKAVQSKVVAPIATGEEAAVTVASNCSNGQYMLSASVPEAAGKVTTQKSSSKSKTKTKSKVDASGLLPGAPYGTPSAQPTYKDLQKFDDADEEDNAPLCDKEDDDTLSMQSQSNHKDHKGKPVADDNVQQLERYFFEGSTDAAAAAQEAGIVLANGLVAPDLFTESTLLGKLVRSSLNALGPSPPRSQWSVFLNTHEPFTLVTVGVQGGGKSHTLAAVLEGCLIPFPEQGVCRLCSPMTTLVLHYDTNASSLCEATGLLSPKPFLKRLLGSEGVDRWVSTDRLTVLVSPSYYEQRKKFYGDCCTVRPLLLQWRTLTADHIKAIMRINDKDNQLYMATMIDLLRQYQRKDILPSLADFFEQVKGLCALQGQGGALSQRMNIFESFVADSERNESLANVGADLFSACQPGHMVVCDMTDPLLSALDVNGIFQVLVQQYRTLPHAGKGRVLACDEAHKYMDGAATDGLSAAIVDVARLMRHDGIRLVVSTQSPRALAPELLELTSVAVLHRFHSRDWFDYLEKKLPLTAAAWETLLALRPGQALVFASRHRVFSPSPIHHSESGEGGRGGPSDRANQSADGGKAGGDISGDEGRSPFGENCICVEIRPRLTADLGASILNKQEQQGSSSTNVAPTALRAVSLAAVGEERMGESP